MNIVIRDNNGQLIGEDMNASPSDVLRYLEKGFNVIDNTTQQPLTESEVVQLIGVSDGVI